jgi:hypothetical protein
MEEALKRIVPEVPFVVEPFNRSSHPIGLFTATCGYRDQAQETLPEDEQDEEGMAVVPLFVIELLEEKEENNTSASPWPQDGQSTRSFSSLRRHKYSKMLPQLLHLNS